MNAVIMGECGHQLEHILGRILGQTLCQVYQSLVSFIVQLVLGAI